MKWWSNKNIRKWLRQFHRDLGYFVVGITLVYAVSGIILNHKETREDPAFKTITEQVEIGRSLTPVQVTDYFEDRFPSYKLNRIIPSEEVYQIFIAGGIGSYNPQNGTLYFEVYKKKPLVFFINKLHYNQKQYWTSPADFYAGVLIFLALSGLIMARGQKSFSGRGKWFVIAGIALVVIFIWL